jgi:hypothetical protein
LYNHAKNCQSFSKKNILGINVGVDFMLDSRLALTGAALAVVIAASYLVINPPEKPRLAPVSESAADIAGEPERELDKPEYMYIIKEHEGRVAVYAAGATEPELVLDVLVRYLPDLDREQMREGVPVNDYEELAALLEDYSS